jgi:hypothetical protein
MWGKGFEPSRPKARILEDLEPTKRQDYLQTIVCMSMGLVLSFAICNELITNPCAYSL